MPVPGFADEPSPQVSERHAPGIALPAGEGRAILERACTTCHDLKGLAAYKGYYDAERWRGLVDTMIAHGAKLDETRAVVLVDYLVEHFGPGARQE